MKLRTVCAVKLAVLVACLCLLLLPEEAITGPQPGQGTQQANCPAQSGPASPRIEAVFVLDTTGSMSGLINAAKEKIWAIANTLASTEPAPLIKIGLVGYRDRGDTYITRQTDLTEDLDAVYNELMSFRADGGGDGPESVNQALYEAISKLSWSRDEDTYRVIFLVGDYPPHMDYGNDVKYPESCGLANKAGIVINTIQCGTHGPTKPVWKDIARRAEGRYFPLEQSGNAVVVSTPYDKKLAEAAREFDKTRIYYGDARARAERKKRAEAADKIYRDASVGAQAQRAIFNAGKAGSGNFLGRQRELVDEAANKRLDVAELKEENLPENMQKMSVGEREKYLADNVAKRKVIQKQVNELAAKRQAYIEKEIEKTGADEKSLDRAIFESVQRQAAKKGTIYKGGPSY